MDKVRQWLWRGILVILILLAGWKYFLPVREPAVLEQQLVSREIVVYVTGAVAAPGLLRLPPDARLQDVLEQAGVLPEADLALLNPAQALKDGQKIVIPAVAPPPAPEPEGRPAGTSSGEPGSTEPGSPETPRTNPPAAPQDSRININKASAEELTKIPGVGPAIAGRIVQYREENGWFAVPEDLMNVSGIGAKTFAKLEPYISVGY